MQLNQKYYRNIRRKHVNNLYETFVSTVSMWFQKTFTQLIEGFYNNIFLYRLTSTSHLPALDFFHHIRIEQGCGIAQILCFTFSNFAKNAAHNFSASCFR